MLSTAVSSQALAAVAKVEGFHFEVGGVEGGSGMCACAACVDDSTRSTPSAIARMASHARWHPSPVCPPPTPFSALGLSQETLTGFKWLGNVAQGLQQRGLTVLFGYEEAIGYMFPTTGLCDKDGITAAGESLRQAQQCAESSMACSRHPQILT